MKKCPVCARSYDDSQFFCLMDGTALIDESETETVVKQSPQVKKSKLPLLMAVLALVIVVLAGAGLGIWLLLKNFDRESAQIENTNKAANNKSSSINSSSPVSSPAAEISPKPDDTKEAPESEDAEEIVPIDWDTTPITFNPSDGQTFKFRCPENGTARIIYGSDIYTLDSSICTAAVHAGVITLESGGVVTVEIRPGRQIYGSTTRNDIKSNAWGKYNLSFGVR